MTSNIDTNHPFAKRIDAHRSELHVHCYRMMGTLEDADDIVQETFIKAWNHRSNLRDSSALRAWLYKIASNTCLDSLKKRKRRQIPRTHASVASVSEPIPSDIHDPIWLQPYPDELISSSHVDGLEKSLSKREDITLAFMAVIHLLPPRQRAILLLRDVLEFKAHEVASLLDTTVSAVKSALFRARTTLANQQDKLSDIEHDFDLDVDLEQQLQQYITAWESANIDDLMQLLKEDAIFSMPPIPSWYRGRAEIQALVAKTIFRGDADGRWRLYPTKANAQPAFGLYRKDEANQQYQFYGIQVLAYSNKQIADILTFRHLSMYIYFNLPPTLPL